MTGEAILCVDDDPAVRAVIARHLEGAGHRCATACDVGEARRLLSTDRYSVVLCDIGLPGESGLDLLAELAATPATATVMVTGRDDLRTADRALELGACGYLTKPFAANELLINVAGAVRRRKLEVAHADQLACASASLALSKAELSRTNAETVARLVRAMEFHDVETGAHVERVAITAHAIAVDAGLDDALCERLRLATPLHDIGKIAIRDAILRKPGPLSAAERREMQRHTVLGHSLLAGSGNDVLELAATIAWTHHENWDGSGYPQRIAGEEIPLASRIVAVADVFDALTTDRPYRRAWPLEHVVAYVRENRQRKFDSDLVDLLESRIHRQKGNVA